ncbi:MAG: hypothetical protein EOO40_00935 [Deltaproteobacteria bacterium]|nr:MAG: hypothetical protein EOO40_00935 [Deltaproteobacteria bacterium]
MTPQKTPQGTYLVNIQGKDFEFRKWGAEEQTDTLIDLIAVAGDGLGSIADIYKNIGADTDLSEGVIKKMVSTFSQGLSRDKAMTKRLLKKLASDRVICDGASINYNTFYQDDLMLSFTVLQANLMVQFGSFLSVVGKFKAAQPAAQMETSGNA